MFVPRGGTSFPGFLGKVKLFCQQVCLAEVRTPPQHSLIYWQSILSHAGAALHFASMHSFSPVNFVWLQVTQEVSRSQHSHEPQGEILMGGRQVHKRKEETE